MYIICLNYSLYIIIELFNVWDISGEIYTLTTYHCSGMITRLFYSRNRTIDSAISRDFVWLWKSFFAFIYLYERHIKSRCMYLALNYYVFKPNSYAWLRCCSGTGKVLNNPYILYESNGNRAVTMAGIIFETNYVLVILSTQAIHFTCQERQSQFNKKLICHL